MLLAVALACVALGAAPVSEPALEHYFTEGTVSAVATEGGCRVMRWDGRDASGITDWPHFATVECAPGQVWRASGWPSEAVSIYVWDGEVTVNGQTLSTVASLVWLQAGFAAAVEVRGKAVAYGGAFRFNPGPGAQFPSSYDAPTHRFYRVEDAVATAGAGRANASMQHDPHQRDGESGSNCWDFVWSSLTRVDPPAITVIGCNQSGSWVGDHFHPWGATYIPLSGTACFHTPVRPTLAFLTEKRKSPSKWPETRRWSAGVSLHRPRRGALDLAAAALQRDLRPADAAPNPRRRQHDRARRLRHATPKLRPTDHHASREAARPLVDNCSR